MKATFQDQVVLITGASSGFGEASARLFAHEGAIVALAARRVDRLRALADEIKTAGGKALVVPVDVSHLSRIEAMVDAVIGAYGRIDILFNNAGFARLNWLEDLDPLGDIESQVQVNLLGVIQTTRAVLPHMLARRSGHIINMSSVAGWVPAPLYTIYAATKFGVRGFNDALRRELSPFGIRVSGIYPGGATTEFGQHVGDSPLKRAVKTPRWLVLSAEQVAHKVVGLAKRPRRSLVIPWWMLPVSWVNAHFPALVDWAIQGMVRKYHVLSEE